MIMTISSTRNPSRNRSACTHLSLLLVLVLAQISVAAAAAAVTTTVNEIGDSQSGSDGGTSASTTSTRIRISSSRRGRRRNSKEERPRLRKRLVGNGWKVEEEEDVEQKEELEVVEEEEELELEEEEERQLQSKSLPSSLSSSSLFFDWMFSSSSSSSSSQSQNEEGVDLGIRFNKFNYASDIPPMAYEPLTNKDYPLSGDTAMRLKTYSDAISVICEGDPALIDNHQALIQRYITAIGGLPTMPTKATNNNNEEFWDDFRPVVEMQIERIHANGNDPGFQLPLVWQQHGRNTISQVSEAVHDEYPGSLQVELIQYLFNQGVKLDHDIIPFRSNADFVGLQVALADLNTWAIAEVAPMNFYIKWYAGRPRPEEIAYKIATNQLTYKQHGVPPDIVNKIRLMGLNSPHDFTAYPEGSPRHPAWPAMHSAASSASFWLAVVLDLTPNQYCEALLVDYAVAFARSCAGVHYPTDNTAGLNLGQTIIAERLGQHLADKYGSNIIKVRNKISKLQFDWRNFNSRDCSSTPYYKKLKSFQPTGGGL